jgi:hypothetical protein
VAFVLVLDTHAPATAWRQVGHVVGEVNLQWLSRDHRQGEIGFVFNPDYQGNGLATEAAKVMLRLGFDGLGLHRVIGRCDARNGPSARLMERLGMRREAHFVHNEIFKGVWGEELVYAMLDHEWKALQGTQGPRRLTHWAGRPTDKAGTGGSRGAVSADFEVGATRPPRGVSPAGRDAASSLDGHHPHDPRARQAHPPAAPGRPRPAALAAA